MILTMPWRQAKVCTCYHKSLALSVVEVMDRVAKLCEACAGIFDGHWTERQVQEPEIEASSVEEDEEDFGAIFYEQPDWLQAPSSRQEAVPYEHHNMEQLQISASNCCTFCMRLWSQVSDGMGRLDAAYSRFVRPEPRMRDKVLAPDILTLQLRIFMDGKHDDVNSYVPLVINFVLYPFDGMLQCAIPLLIHQ
ncbi:hypothetical protein BST61_g10005 [Cercospora zeina]